MVLVKKDQTWHFCVNYCLLNAITVKGKFLVQVIDELFDELSGASGFSILDLQAGFHKVRMNSGEEHETAFQTHFCQLEFRVMVSNKQ